LLSRLILSLHLPGSSLRFGRGAISPQLLKRRVGLFLSWHGVLVEVLVVLLSIRVVAWHILIVAIPLLRNFILLLPLTNSLNLV
jgi:hypothetical protein